MEGIPNKFWLKLSYFTVYKEAGIKILGISNVRHYCRGDSCSEEIQAHLMLHTKKHEKSWKQNLTIKEGMPTENTVQSHNGIL